MAIKVAIVEPTGGHSGMDRAYDYGLCMGLISAEINPVLYTCDATISPPDHLQVHTLFKNIYGNDPAWKRGIRYLKSTLRVHWHAKRSGSQIVHYHLFHTGPLELFNYFLSRCLRMQIVVTAHDVISLKKQTILSRLQNWVLSSADGVIVHNEYSRSALPAVKQASTIGLGVDTYAVDEKLPEQDQARKVLNIPTDSYCLLFFGQLKDVKGLDILLESLPEIISSIPDLQLLIAGRPWKTDSKKYVKLAEQLSVSEHCHWHLRFIPNNEVAQFFAATNIVVLPYKRIYQSAVLLMGMSYGIPMLTSDLPAMKEQITDNETAFLFKAGDPSSLANKVIEMHAFPQLTKKVGENGKGHVLENHSWSSIGKQTACFYRQILK